MKVGINNIKLKLTLFYTFILVILLFAFHFVAYSLLSSGLSHDLTDSLTIELQEVQIIREAPPRLPLFCAGTMN